MAAHNSLTSARFLAGVCAFGVIGHAAALAAQTPVASPAKAANGMAAGIVYDSLLRKPLSRATVRIQDTDLATIADMEGRFSFDAVPEGRHVFVFAAPALDNAGLRSAGVPVDIVAGKTVTVALGTPTLRRLWQALCTGRPRLSLDSGIVTGTVVDGDRNVRLRRAPTALSWYNLRSSDEEGVYPEVRAQVETDSTGAYVACGLPTEVSIKAKAFGDDAATGEVQYFVGDHKIRRVDMVVTAAFASGEVARGTATLRGVVRDSSGRPVADAIVAVPAADTSTRTLADGSFVIRGLAAGTQGLQVRKVGFGMTTPVVSLRSNQESATEIVMSGVTMLDTYAVRGEHKVTLDEREFLDRRKVGLGIYIDPAKRSASDPVSFLTNLPRVKVTYTKSGAVPNVTMLFANRECTPGMYLDGIPTDAERMRDYPVDRIRAVEVFNSGMMLPAQFIRNVQVPCGAVAYWTKNAW